MTFFKSTNLDRMLKGGGLDESEPAPSDRYTNPDASASAQDSAIMIFDKLCVFAFATTESGRMALVPPFTRPGDRICVLFGCSSPLVLEPSPVSPGRFRLRGEACIDGFMFGEAIQQLTQGWRNKKMFDLE